MFRSRALFSFSANAFSAGSCGIRSRNPCTTIMPVTQAVSTLEKKLSTLAVRRDIPSVSLTLPPLLYQPSREYAARKGTRAKRAAKKVKKVEVKKPFVFKKYRDLLSMPYLKQRPFDDSGRPMPEDDVYFYRAFREKRYPFEEAVKCMREHHHPTVANVPNAPVYLRINMCLKYTGRSTKLTDKWRSVVEMKSPFILQGMNQPTVLAFCKEDADYITSVLQEGGADMAGGKEIIKAIQNGEVNPDDYEYLVASPEIVPDLTAIRGLIKRKFPKVSTRTISSDLVTETKRLKSGIKVQLLINDREPDFGYIETPIGTLDMEGLYDNYVSLLADAVPRRAPNKLPSDFVLTCQLSTPGNGAEKFLIDHTELLNALAASKKSSKNIESEAEESLKQSAD